MPPGVRRHQYLSLRIWTLGGREFELHIHSSKTIAELHHAVRKLTHQNGQFDLLHHGMGAIFGFSKDYGSAEWVALQHKTLHNLHVRNGSGMQLLAIDHMLDEYGDEIPALISDNDSASWSGEEIVHRDTCGA